MLFVLPFIHAYTVMPIICLTLLSCPLIKLCWKFIICSVLKFHFNAFTWDHVLPVV